MNGVPTYNTPETLMVFKASGQQYHQNNSFRPFAPVVQLVTSKPSDVRT